MRQHGFSMKQRQEVLSKDAGFRHLFLTLDTKYLLRKEKGEVEILIFDSQTSDSFRIIKQANGKILAARYYPQFKVATARVDGRVYGSLLGSILPKLNSNWVASRFMDAYAFEMKTGKRLEKGAKFWFTVEKKYLGGHFVKYGEVTQTYLEIRGEAIQKRFVRVMNGGVFFNQNDLLDDKPFYAPVDYIKIASQFQPRRLHPITKRLQPHLGVDFELPVGDPVYAPRAGTVVRYGNNRAAGNYIVLQHANGRSSLIFYL